MPKYTKTLENADGKKQTHTIETSHPGTGVQLLASGYTEVPETTASTVPDTNSTAQGVGETADTTPAADPATALADSKDVASPARQKPPKK